MRHIKAELARMRHIKVGLHHMSHIKAELARMRHIKVGLHRMSHITSTRGVETSKQMQLLLREEIV